MTAEVPLVDSPKDTGNGASTPRARQNRGASRAAYCCPSADSLGTPCFFAHIHTSSLLTPRSSAFIEIVERSGLGNGSAAPALHASVDAIIRPGFAGRVRLLQDARVNLETPKCADRVRSLATWHARAPETLPIPDVQAALAAHG